MCVSSIYRVRDSASTRDGLSRRPFTRRAVTLHRGEREEERRREEAERRGQSRIPSEREKEHKRGGGSP